MGETQKNREPICGFCWAYREIRQPLIYLPQHGLWECPLCKAKVIDPTDDAESLARDLCDEDPNRFEKTIASMLRSHPGGGGGGGRRRKKRPKTTKIYLGYEADVKPVPRRKRAMKKAKSV